ncbi:acetylornithine deacetylase [Roseinatronobacter alkalisoli]|uniref:Acetylornithine deacetylase n=1 Tax=Roseinatronobacter alkalisoli TaxID=3028235 RepID=A0ABT5TDL8_9RHOB|nr:acetylornithine deacetylase [Roseinatronobacter sp. HJB301]MDD7972257.1 acetylornithine deacetylase [Roseinatronobacter sp. HJB301]
MPSAATQTALKALIGFDTTSRNSNLPLIDWAEDWLTRHGAVCRRVHDATGTKANLWATFGPADVPGWVLSGHTDTVPVDGQNWTTDPFRLTERDGRFYGRGTCDMKGFIACCLGLAPVLQHAALARPVHLALSYDEEIGCLGVRGLLRMVMAEPVQPMACIVGEPTLMQVCIGHKTKRSLRATFTGTTGHSSRAPQFVNAVEYGARLIAHMQAIGHRLATEGLRDPMYDTPHSTAHVGTAHGGTALNIVPARFVTEFEFRVLTQEDADALVDEVRIFIAETLLPDMQRIDPAADISLEVTSFYPGLDTAVDAPVAVTARRLANRNDSIKVAYGTEGGLFHEMANIPTVICGPGSIGQAHQPDEFVAANQLDACEAFLRGIINECR